MHRAAKTLNSMLLSARNRQRYARMLVQHQKNAADAATVRMTKTAGAVDAEAEAEATDTDEKGRRKQEADVKANVQAEERQREKTESHAIAKAIGEAEAERVVHQERLVQRLTMKSRERAMHAQSKQTFKSMADEAGIKTTAGSKLETLRNDVQFSRHVPIDHENGGATELGQAASETAEKMKRQAPQRALSSTPWTKRRVNIHVPVSKKSSEEDLDRQPQLSADAALALLNQHCHVDQSQPATGHSDSQMYQAALRKPQSEASSTSVSDPNCMLEQSSQFGGVYKREQRRQTAVAVCGMRNRYHDSEAKEADCRIRNHNHDAACSEFDLFRRTASGGAILQRRARGPESVSPRHAQQHGAGPEGQNFARLVLEHLFTPPSNVLSPFLMLQCLYKRLTKFVQAHLGKSLSRATLS